MEIFPFNEKWCGERSACNFCDAKKFTKARKKYSFGNSLLKYAKVVCLNLLICFIVKHNGTSELSKQKDVFHLLPVIMFLVLSVAK